MASPVLFSACEPCIKVLQSRYRIYRAFNGVREDYFYSTLGGGSYELAPKLDIQRIGSCVFATTLVEFMQQPLATEPDMVLSTQSAHLSSSAGTSSLCVKSEGPQSANNRNTNHNNGGS
ncbi:putative AMP deaminase [Trypanosoma rangeli]|uniref:Putative AMP deaminase n=1 Tax=Trypanosoma rangeli TaxID=5698 RepID=A0A3S5IR54_TRYRA|nr:putative AMP deaminase [Trypanosoma rangeli]RNF04514.1 putative AMP deaminase [Trypanosoma rangeli]|eukprot:RNF04514.1 putative AMP deaminase [Trypanosoma rangeli]